MLSFIIHPIARFSALLMILILVTFSVLDTGGVKTRMSNLVFETYIKMKPRPATGQLMFVDIDDISLSKVGQWPWPRKKVAEMITNIKASGAKVIIFDGVLAEPDRTSPENIAKLLDPENPAREALSLMPRNDGVLARAIEDSENFVAGFSYGSNPEPPMIKQSIKIKTAVKNFFTSQQGPGSLYFQKTAQFLPELQSAAAGNGSFMASAESDAVIRKTGIIFHNGKNIYPSLIVEGIRIFENQGREFVKVSANKSYNNFQISEPFITSIGQYKIPTGADGKIWVYFRHFTKGESESAYQFLNDFYASSKTDLTDKIVFIASSAEGLMDLRATPVGMRPGVHVHMNALEQILQNQYLIRPHTATLLEIGAAFAVCILIIVLSFFVNPLWLAFIAASVSIGSFATSWFLFDRYGGLFDPITPTFMVVFIFLSASILSYLRTEFEKQQVRSAFGMYVSPDVMKDLEKHPEKLRLGGENKSLSVMFTDIRRFTTISEGLAPAELINLMNDFLTAMTDIVLEHEGTIDKYMGDAIMAFWNAPKDVENHERQACIAALKMQAALDPVNQAIKEKAKETGVNPVLLQAGIGVNTGSCAVGNMGSHQRFAYSALGDAVNLASRLEGQTQNYGVTTLIGEETYAKVSNFAILEMDLIMVKGKTQPVRIYALLGDEELAKDEAFKALKERHAEMIKAYQSADFNQTLSALKACRKLDLYNLSMAYDMYESRVKDLQKTPPSGKWDGVYVAKTK